MGAVSTSVELRTPLILLTLATVGPVVLFAVGLIVYQTRLERSSLERGMRDTSRALAVGFDLYITKPVEPSDLARAVARLARR
jgi:CheY-like chemotaxis protein